MYNLNKNIALYLFIAAVLFTSNGCSGHSTTKKPDTASPQKKVVRDTFSATTAILNDEQQFRAFLKSFKAAVKQNNKKQLMAMLNFPLQTLPQWTDEDLKSGSINPAEGLVTEGEYPQYAAVLFSKDAVRLIPQSKEDDLSEIDMATPENYYKTVGRVTDKDSKMYELQQQYVQSGGKETSYGFVFGKVKGQYKIISYFCPWPVKG
jgi:hypothetical protein